MKHMLIVGRPGVGKTTLVKQLIETVRHGPIDGFITEELREGEERMGFWLSPLDGRQVLLAHRDIESRIHVGPYKVNVSVMDEIAVSVIRRGMKKALVLFLDELGKMELCSRAFEQVVQEAFDKGPSVVATATVAPLPFLDVLKRRKDVELIPLTNANRSVVAEELTERLIALCAEDDSLRNLERQADHICEMIVSGNSPLIDIEIQQSALREAFTRTFPEKQTLYQLIYESRFRRLWQQFRHE